MCWCLLAIPDRPTAKSRNFWLCVGSVRRTRRKMASALLLVEISLNTRYPRRSNEKSISPGWKTRFTTRRRVSPSIPRSRQTSKLLSSMRRSPTVSVPSRLIISSFGRSLRCLCITPALRSARGPARKKTPRHHQVLVLHSAPLHHPVREAGEAEEGQWACPQRRESYQAAPGNRQGRMIVLPRLTVAISHPALWLPPKK